MKQRIRERVKDKSEVRGWPEVPARLPPHESVDEAVTIRNLFARLSTRRSDPRLKAMDGVYQFEVEGFGSWYLTVKRGSLTVSRGPVAVDCAIVFSPEDFIDIASGRRNLMSAFLQGRVSGWGDIGMALAFRRLLPLSS
jgi:predicted lipid carrier protein YhbT